MTRFKVVFLGFIAIVLLSAIKANAGQTAKPWSGALTASGARNMVDLKDGSRADSAATFISLNYSSSIGQIGSGFGYDYGLNQATETSTGVSDSYLTYSHFSQQWKFLDAYKLTLTPAVKLILPLSRETQTVEKLQTSTIFSITYKLTSLPKKSARELAQGLNQSRPQSIADRFSYSFGLSAGRNFHQYESTLDGDNLNKYSSNQSLGVNYDFKNLNISVDFVHKNRWSYQNEMRESYAVSEELGYLFQKSWNLAIGHTNSGSALKPNANDSNLSIFDERQSMIYFTASYLL